MPLMLVPAASVADRDQTDIGSADVQPSSSAG